MNVILNKNQRLKIAKQLNFPSRSANLTTRKFINLLYTTFNKNYVNGVIRNIINNRKFDKNEYLNFLRRELARTRENPINLTFLKKIYKNHNSNITSKYVGNQLRGLNNYLKK